jgi:hypothetical protein
MSDRFRMSDTAPFYALLIVVAAIALLVLIVAAMVHWLLWASGAEHQLKNDGTGLSRSPVGGVMYLPHTPKMALSDLTRGAS